VSPVRAALAIDHIRFPERPVGRKLRRRAVNERTVCKYDLAFVSWRDACKKLKSVHKPEVGARPPLVCKPAEASKALLWDAMRQRTVKGNPGEQICNRSYGGKFSTVRKSAYYFVYLARVGCKSLPGSFSARRDRRRPCSPGCGAPPP
jgi:hypothetical protein